MKRKVLFLLWSCCLFVKVFPAIELVQKPNLCADLLESLRESGDLSVDHESEALRKFKIWGDLLTLINLFFLESGEKKEDIALIVQGLINLIQSSGALAEEYDSQELLRILRSFDKNELKVFFKSLLETVKKYLSDDLGQVIDLLTSCFKENLKLKSLPFGEELIYKDKNKKRQIAAAIFGALADVCAHATQIATAQSEDDKQQGALNLFGTAFGLASHIAAISMNENFKGADQEVIDLAVLLVEDVCDLIKDEKDRQYSDEAIALLLDLSRMEDEAARKEKILNSLASQALAEKILSASLSFLRTFLHEKVDEVVDFLEEKLHTFFMGYKLLFMRQM
jgi:hypothetical protein